MELKITLMDSDLKLLGLNHSMFTFRVIWALKLKGIEYDFIEKGLSKPCPLLRQYNPVHKLVPVLIHDGKPICESSIILEYIDETWKQRPLFPQDLFKEPTCVSGLRLLMTRSFERSVLSSFFSILRGFLTIELVFQIVGASQKAFSSSGEEQAKACDVMSEALKLLDEEINGKKFFEGEEIGYLDLMLGWIAYWLQVSEEVSEYKAMDPAKFPSLNEWTNNFLQNPIIKNNVPPLDELRKTFSLFKRLSVSAEK